MITHILHIILYVYICEKMIGRSYFIIHIICISYLISQSFCVFINNLNLYVIIHLIYFLHMYANLRNRCKPHPLYSFLPFSFNLFKTLFFFFFYIKFIIRLLLPTLVFYQKERKKYLYTYLNLVVQRYIYILIRQLKTKVS